MKTLNHFEDLFLDVYFWSKCYRLLSVRACQGVWVKDSGGSVKQPRQMSHSEDLEPF